MRKTGGNSWLNAVKKWISRRLSTNYCQETVIKHSEPNVTTISISSTESSEDVEGDKAKQRHALAVAMATAAAAQAAVATAQAAMEVARLARPRPSSFQKKREAAALCIQTAFRAYLARRALRALKGLVKLQALVRGHNVRKRAKMTLKCMQALVRVQTRFCEQRRRLSYEGSTIPIDSVANSHLNNMWAGGYCRDTYASEGEAEDKTSRLEKCRRRVSLSSYGQTEIDSTTSLITKTVEIDTSTPYSYSNYSTPYATPQPHQQHTTTSITSSPDSTLPSRKTTSVQANSASSPRCSLTRQDRMVTNSIPNYMAATASTKARIRSQSAPKQRVSNPDRSAARKRLNFAVAEPERDDWHVDLRSNISTCCTMDSAGDGVSFPTISAADLNRLLR